MGAALPVPWSDGLVAGTGDGSTGAGPRRGVQRRSPTAWRWISQTTPTTRISHEAIYQALYLQGRGALCRDLTACLRTSRALRVPRSRARAHGKAGIAPEILTSGRPADVRDRTVPGHWEGDLILGLHSSAIGTLVERTT